MADEKKAPENDADLLAAPGPKPRPWSHIIVGMIGATALGIAALLLAQYFTATRPIDLMPTTAALGDYLERVLRDNLVAPNAIHRSPAILREEAGCRWYYHEFQLDLPPQISAQGLRELLVKGMSERQARVSSEDPLEFAVGPYPFATVLMRGKDEPTPAAPTMDAHAPEVPHAVPGVPEVPSAPEPVDPAAQAAMRASAREVAAAALETLKTVGAPAESLPGLADHDVENATSPWILTQVTLTGWTPPSLESLLSAMNAAVTPLGGSAEVSADGIAVSHAGHVVVAVTLPTTPNAEQPVEVTALTPSEMPQALPSPEPAPEPAPVAPAMPQGHEEQPTPREDLREESLALGAQVRAALIEAGIPEAHLVALPNEPQEDATTLWTTVHLQVRGGSPVPPAKVLTAVVEHVVRPGVEASIDESSGQAELLLRLGGHQVVLAELAPRAAEVSMVPSYEDLPPETNVDTKEGEGAHPTTEPPAHEGPPRMALIVDDGGYGKAATETVLGLDPKLTLAILPFTPFGEDTAQRGAALGFEIMLHMPMEPFSAAVKFKGQLNVGMGADEIARLTHEAIATVPGMVGINNHTGSKFTSDPASMQLFFDALAGQPYYFIDSVTSGNSQAYAIAKAAGLRTARRSVFLDDKADAAYIRKQFEILRARAKHHGTAIGICHFRPKTAEILAGELDKIHEDGIELVHASELVQ